MFKRKEITKIICDDDNTKEQIIKYTINEYNENYKLLLFYFSDLPFLEKKQVQDIITYIQKLGELFYNIDKTYHNSNKVAINDYLLIILEDIVKYSSIVCYHIYQKASIFLHKDKSKIKLIYDILTHNIKIYDCILKNKTEVYITSSKNKFY